MGPSAAAHTPDAKLETAENAATEYKPAVTWDGLPSIGGNQGIQWEREHVWEGSVFLDAQKAILSFHR